MQTGDLVEKQLAVAGPWLQTPPLKPSLYSPFNKEQVANILLYSSLSATPLTNRTSGENILELIVQNPSHSAVVLIKGADRIEEKNKKTTKKKGVHGKLQRIQLFKDVGCGSFNPLLL